MTTTATAPIRPKAAKNAKAAKGTELATFEKPTDTPLIQDLGGTLMDVPLTDVLEPTWAPDRIPGPEDQAEIEGLARSMHAATQLQPILLERTSRGMVRVFGRRRVAAARLLGWETIKAVVVPELSEVQRRTVIAVENIQRKQLTGIEETLGVMELVELQALEAARQVCTETGRPLECQGAWGGRLITDHEVDFLTLGGSNEMIAAARHDMLLDHRVRDRACVLVGALLSRDTKWVRDRMYIGRLDKVARELIRAGKLPLQHAREIAKVADEKRRSELAKAYAAGGSDSTSDTEAGPFDELQSEVSRCLVQLDQAPWRLDVEFVGKPACVTCPHNSANQPGLFDHGGRASTDIRKGEGYGGIYRDLTDRQINAGICTKHECYAEKLRCAKAHLSNTAKRVVDQEKEPTADAKLILDPESIKEKVKDRRASRGNRTHSHRSSKRIESPEAIAKREAQNKLSEALVNRASKIDTAARRSIGKDPVGLLYVNLFADWLREHRHGPDAKRDRWIRSAEFTKFAKALAKPTLEDVESIARALPQRDCEIVNDWYDGENGIADAIAKALSIDVGPAPKLEDFMPKAADAAAADAKPAGKKSGGKAKKAKRGGKGKGVRGAA